MNGPSNTDTPLREPEEPPSWRARIAAAWNRLVNKIAKTNAEELREAIEELIEEPSATTGMPAAERLLLANLLQLHERTVADCKIPRSDIAAIDIDTPLAELVAMMTETQHSRIPVYRETLDDVLGMVHMKDVMDCLAHNRDCKVRDLLRQVLFVAPTTPAIKLMLQMRSTRHYMAMVVDEFGGVDGLVTIEDLVEEIVGDINDEHDEVVPPRIMMRGDGSMIVEARLPIEEFEGRVGAILTESEREEIDTLGGLVFILAGRIPQVGETFRHSSGVEFDVIELDHSRVKRVRVRNLPAAAGEADAGKLRATARQ
ncbi:MAG: CBS domain-containing protein [Alphaproteobacteria bacterium]|nr:CBS domain-containing protein [Alphaproteobacteria bacterium]